MWRTVIFQKYITQTVGLLTLLLVILLSGCQRDDDPNSKETPIATPFPTYNIPAPSANATMTTTTTPDSILAATLTRQGVEVYMATQSALGSYTTATSDILPMSLTEVAANSTAAQAAEKTRRAGITAGMSAHATQAAAGGTPTPNVKTVDIPIGAEPQLDGVIDNREWSDAASRVIVLEDGEQITVWVKHSAAHLYVAYTGLSGSGQQLVPELLLDMQNDKSSQLDDNDWWFQATATPEGWRVSPWTTDTNVVEMAIPYETIGLLPGETQPVGISFAVLTVTVDGRELRHFWPGTAVLDSPQTWSTAQTADGW